MKNIWEELFLKKLAASVLAPQWAQLRRFAIDSKWKIRRYFIDFESRIHVQVMTSIRHGIFDVDSTFKTDQISMSFPRGFFDVF